jgi:hypothetical protein
MSVKNQQVTKEATANRAPAAPAVINRVRGSAGNHTLRTQTPEHSYTSARIQPKLTISTPGDTHEQEADRLADRVMRMPERSLQRACACGGGCARYKNEEQRVQRRSLASTITPFMQAKADAGGVASDAISNRIVATRGSGRALPGGPRKFMEGRFGTDFSNVRIHSGPDAIQMSQELNAQAFTVGSDVYFNSGKYSPESPAGKQLLAHELTHTVQQQSNIGFMGGSGVLQAQPLGVKEEPPTLRFRKEWLQEQHQLGLKSPQFSSSPDLTAVYENKLTLQIGSTGLGVQSVQQALIDLGYLLPRFGANKNFGPETETAVRAYQKAHYPPLSATGVVDHDTIAALDHDVSVFNGSPTAFKNFGSVDDRPIVDKTRVALRPFPTQAAAETTLAERVFPTRNEDLTGSIKLSVAYKGIDQELGKKEFKPAEEEKELQFTVLTTTHTDTNSSLLFLGGGVETTEKLVLIKGSGIFEGTYVPVTVTEKIETISLGIGAVSGTLQTRELYENYQKVRFQYRKAIEVGKDLIKIGGKKGKAALGVGVGVTLWGDWIDIPKGQW